MSHWSLIIDVTNDWFITNQSYLMINPARMLCWTLLPTSGQMFATIVVLQLPPNESWPKSGSLTIKMELSMQELTCFDVLGWPSFTNNSSAHNVVIAPTKNAGSLDRFQAPSTTSACPIYFKLLPRLCSPQIEYPEAPFETDHWLGKPLMTLGYTSAEIPVVRWVTRLGLQDVRQLGLPIPHSNLTAGSVLDTSFVARNESLHSQEPKEAQSVLIGVPSNYKYNQDCPSCSLFCIGSAVQAFGIPKTKWLTKKYAKLP